MNEAIVLRLPDETAHRYRRGAEIAHKRLDEFLVERLQDVAPLLSEDAPSPFREELRALERLGDKALCRVARSRLQPAQQRLYSRLLRRNSAGTLGPQEQGKLRSLGEMARLMTLRKAHAFMMLRWRGHRIPSPSELLSGK